MGKRSNFKRRKHDKYATPYECVPDLMPHLAANTRFIEPCAGNGALVKHLENLGHTCEEAWDIKPKGPGIIRRDAMTGRVSRRGLFYITNPPWTREILHPLIEHLSDQAPTWLLFDADWAHTKQAIPYLRRCHAIIPIGRVKWIPGSAFVGKDNAAWYLFDYRTQIPTLPTFYPRAA